MGRPQSALGKARRPALKRARQGRKKGVKKSERLDFSFIERYSGRSIDKGARLLFMNPSTPDLAAWEKEYARLREQLGQVSWISEGYVQDRGPGAGGPCYQWTRKVKGKTVSVALSKEQFEWLRAAIAQWRELQATLKEMQRLSRRVLFETVPHPPRRKKLGQKVLGLM